MGSPSFTLLVTIITAGLVCSTIGNYLTLTGELLGSLSGVAWLLSLIGRKQ